MLFRSRKAYPCAHISLLVKPWVSEIFKENPDIDEIILYEDTYKSILGKLKLAEILRQKKFICSILLQNAFDAVFVTWLAKIPVRIGYASDMRRILLTEALPVHNSIHQQHQVFYYLNLIKSAGIETAESQPYLCLSDDERKQEIGRAHV